MKITSFYPAIITKNIDDTLFLMEQLGFLVAHKQEDVIEDGSTEYVLEHPNDFRMSIIYSDHAETDLQITRINVDDIEEAKEFYSDMGFSVSGEQKNNEFSKSQLMKSPAGLVVMITEHIKN